MISVYFRTLGFSMAADFAFGWAYISLGSSDILKHVALDVAFG